MPESKSEPVTTDRLLYAPHNQLAIDFSDSVSEKTQEVEPVIRGSKLAELFGSTNTKMKIWTEDMTMTLSLCSYNCFKNYWLHDKDAKYYHQLDMTYTSISSLLSVFSSLMITSLMGFFEEGEIVFYILCGISILANLLITMLNTLSYIYNYTRKVVEHSETANKYFQLHRKITTQFSLPPEFRYSAKILLEYVIERMDELERERPFNVEKHELLWGDAKSKFRNELYSLPQESRKRILREFEMRTVEDSEADLRAQIRETRKKKSRTHI